MQSSELLVTQLGRLANRIVAGEVVFFIGSGFSIDSEKNTAAILVARLVARFEAISDVVAESPAHKDGALGALCAELKAGLRRTFSLDAGKTGDIWPEIKKNIGLLTEGTNYYQINDWMCSAFDWLLAHSAALVALSLKIHARENEHLKRFHAVDQVGHKWPLTPVDYGRFGDLCKETSDSATERTAAGKALFLETMGFGDRAVMAGNFLAAPEYVSGAYVGRLRPRHFALAWMAHEGLLPVVVTTNYDLLLEGAFRLAGMEPQMAEENLKNPLEAAPGAGSNLRWNRRLQHFTPIADATEFFSYGDGYESAMLLKIHGCVYRYRYESRTAAGWRNVLPTMVFTFREIQNWREDSWSRDFLRTLMRTRTVAFAGYSTADPVIHDTFRSVYEEMARYRARRFRQQHLQHEQDHPAESSGAAFYYSAATKREFHALEVLRASSLAVGATRAELTSHPNMIGFHFESGPGFPKLDEAMLWTYHVAYRQLQRQALENELRRVYNQLFFKPCPDTDAKAIIASFETLVAGETARGKALEEAARDAEQSSDPRQPDRVAARRAEMQRAVGWTANFHRQLMRELAAADLLVREPERASRVHAAMRWPWYAAVTDHPDWGAWAVVLELALRCRSAAWLQLKNDWKGAAEWIEPIPADRPALLLPPTASNDRPSAPRLCLSIEVPELRLMMSCRESARTLHLLPRVALSLRAHAVPWRRQDQEPQGGPGQRGQPDVQALPAPAPQLVWSWALGDGSRGSTARSDAAVFFGGTHVRPFERNAGRRR